MGKLDKYFARYGTILLESDEMYREYVQDEKENKDVRDAMLSQAVIARFAKQKLGITGKEFDDGLITWDGMLDGCPVKIMEMNTPVTEYFLFVMTDFLSMRDQRNNTEGRYIFVSQSMQTEVQLSSVRIRNATVKLILLPEAACNLAGKGLEPTYGDMSDTYDNEMKKRHYIDRIALKNQVKEMLRRMQVERETGVEQDMSDLDMIPFDRIGGK